jgi:hypothetical protein
VFFTVVPWSGCSRSDLRGRLIVSQEPRP